MNLVEDEQGSVDIKGESYSIMPSRLSILIWSRKILLAAAGTPTIYEAIYPETVEWLKEVSQVLENCE